ncbi:TPA: Fis family transcriptional regulator [Escherichia coli]|nr:Fis family transcriptional regulator [Escherichia coli]HCJ8562882.1 Fis family transcriptional regulator [Escherichia coli]
MTKTVSTSKKPRKQHSPTNKRKKIDGNDHW